jgi:energy-coupling factor transporter ATP-binding protein EcfA2
VIAGGNAEFAEYVVRWIAWSVQNPAAQAEVALVLIGHKGVGKGTLVRCLQRIFGAHAFQVTSREEVIGKFNGHLQDCVLFVADEAYWGGDKRCVGRLQGMITEPTLPIERKGFDLILVPNYLHVLMLAEPGWVIPAGRYERRYGALRVSDRRMGDREYFNALHRQIDGDGTAAMMWDLQRMDLGVWHPREIPESLLKGTALQEQQVHTLPPLEQWYLSLLQDGRVPKALINNNPKSKKMSRPSTAYTKSLREDAIERFPRLRWELSDNALEEFMTDESWPKATKFRDAKNNGWTFEPLAESRAQWDQRYGPQRWSEGVEWGRE